MSPSQPYSPFAMVCVLSTIEKDKVAEYRSSLWALVKPTGGGRETLENLRRVTPSISD